MPFQAEGERASAAIVRLLMRQMSTGELSVGDRLPPERDMARLFKTSRACVREAHRSLEELGLLRVRRGNTGGAFVRRVNYEPVRRSMSLVFGMHHITHQELAEACLLIEPLVARLAALRASPASIARLRAALTEEEDAARGNSGDSQYHSEFFRHVAACARNFPMKVLIEALADLAGTAASGDISLRYRRQRSRFHRLLLQAIERRDAAAAYTITMRHISKTRYRSTSHRAEPGRNAGLQRHAPDGGVRLPIDPH